MRGFELGAAFVLFGADIQQADAGAGKVHAVASIRRPHQCVLQQIVFIGADVRTDVQHDVKAAFVARGPEAGNCRAVHTRQFAQAHHRQRHQRARVATGDTDSGIATAHGLNRGPHRRALAVTHHVAGLFVHGDHAFSVSNLAPTRQRFTLGDQLVQHVLGAVENKADVRILGGRARNAGNHGCRPTIPTHRVNRKNGARSAGFLCIRRICHDAARTLRGLCRVFVQIDLVGLSNDLTVGIVAASTANVVRTLQFATVRALCRVARNQCIVRTALVAARPRDFILRDSHVSTSVFGGRKPL